MKCITTYIFGLSLLLFFGCLSGPDSSRINSYDPGSEIFKPLFTDLKIKVATTEKRAQISWLDRSAYNDGFIVKRRYSSKGKFEPIDTTSTISFTELLTDYSLEMEYQISSYYLRGNKINLGQSTETEHIDFGGLTSIGYFSQNDSVFVQWFRNTAFDDRITIEYKEQNSSQWSTISTIQQSEMSGEFHRTSFVLPKGQTYNFRIEASLQNYNNEYETFFEREFSLNH
tara:strand:- start:2936 stop:3619 length:684 start_codon:yes stop_codon:yes gene_type:complete